MDFNQLQPDQQQPKETTPQKKRLIAIVAIVVAVVVIGVVAILLVQQSQEAERQKQAEQAQAQAQAEAKAKQEALLGETYTNEQAGISVRFPKGWREVAKAADDTRTIVKFQNSQPEPGAVGPASGELNSQRSNATMDDHARAYIEESLDVSIESEIIDHKDVEVGGQRARLLSYEVPGPGDLSGRITLYLFYKNGTFYDLSFTTLTSTWDGHKAAIEASANSLKIN
jgi:hypothetical protein